MSATQKANAYFQFSAAGTMPELEPFPGAAGVIRGLKIFRRGSFRDSKGRQSEWSAADLSAMVSNFSMLRQFQPHVPQRLDHSRSVKDVVGYFDSVSTDGDFMYGDFVFTREDAAEMYRNGTLRNRSLEVGVYRTNDEDEIQPVPLGLAWCDLPAVEGLHSLHSTTDSNVAILQEIPDMPDFKFSLNGIETTDFAAAQAHILDLEAKLAAAPKVFKFTVAGEETVDPTVAQARLDVLEAVVTETRESARKDFVKGLAAEDKVLASQVEALTEFALALDEAQYAAWSKTYEAAPKLGVLAPSGGGDNSKPPANGGTVLSGFELDLEVVENMRLTLPEEKVAESGAYKRLVAAGQPTRRA